MHTIDTPTNTPLKVECVFRFLNVAHIPMFTATIHLLTPFLQMIILLRLLPNTMCLPRYYDPKGTHTHTHT